MRIAEEVVTMVIFVTLAASHAGAGSLDPSNVPGPTMRTLEDVYRILADLPDDTKIGLNNTNAPTSSMHTIEEIYQLALSLTATNSGAPVGILRSGQTISYTTGDDGDLESGVAWPSPVFTVGTGTASNCVTDHRTGLMWVRNPSDTKRNWADALTYCRDTLNAESVQRGLGGYTDWRMPQPREALSLLDYSSWGGTNGLLPSGHPFVGALLGNSIWTSTTLPWATDRVWNVNTGESFVGIPAKVESNYVWAVRGGD